MKTRSPEWKAALAAADEIQKALKRKQQTPCP